MPKCLITVAKSRLKIRNQKILDRVVTLSYIRIYVIIYYTAFISDRRSSA